MTNHFHLALPDRFSVLTKIPDTTLLLYAIPWGTPMFVLGRIDFNVVYLYAFLLFLESLSK